MHLPFRLVASFSFPCFLLFVASFSFHSFSFFFLLPRFPFIILSFFFCCLVFLSISQKLLLFVVGCLLDGSCIGDIWLDSSALQSASYCTPQRRAQSTVQCTRCAPPYPQQSSALRCIEGELGARAIPSLSAWLTPVISSLSETPINLRRNYHPRRQNLIGIKTIDIGII